MRFEEALSWLSQFEFHGIRPGLTRIYRLLKKLGHPERKFLAIHIAGTNGKGSTAAFLENILRTHGLKTGLYTSPHLVSICERFVIAGHPISREKFASYCARIKEALGDSAATYFELTTALAFLLFAEEGVDVAVVECGLGGRLDATNLLRPALTIITGIGLDHQAYLGHTLGQIAWEKAGILKRGCPLVLGKTPPEAREVILKRAKSLEAPVFEFGRHFEICPAEEGLTYRGELCLSGLEPGLKGRFQWHNLALALKGAEILARQGVFSLEESAVKEAVASTFWPGRFEILKTEPPLILDGAHNLEGIETLLSCMEEEGLRPFNLVFAASDEGGTKPYRKMLEKLLPFAQTVYLCEPPGPRRPVTMEEWQRWLAEEKPPGRFMLVSDPLEAVKKALKEPLPVLVTGSLYLVGQIREKIANPRSNHSR